MVDFFPSQLSILLILRSVSDSLEYSPERCTVVVCYEKLVVGVAIMSSPQETYITYLAVKAGWDKAHIARLVWRGPPLWA
jgi:hypothetical protein